MSLIEIDDVAARQRLHEIAAGNKAALDAHVRRSAELAERARQAFEREEADLKATLARKAEAEARAAEREKAPPAEETRPRPRPTTLSLGAEEFKQVLEPRQAAPPPGPPSASPSVPPAPDPAPEPPRPSRTLKLGAPADREDEPVATGRTDDPGRDEAGRKPAERRRPPRSESDDDMSGRTWLR
jgi:hypothetical protein